MSTNTCGQSTGVAGGIKALGVAGPYFKTTDIVAPLAEAFGRWGIVEWNPSDPFSDSIDIYREDVLTVRRYRPALLMPYKIPSDHWKTFDLDGATLPFETALRELMGGRSGNSSHPGIATAGGWLPRITWATPARLLSGQALTSTRLNAVSNIAGTFVYYSDANLTQVLSSNSIVHGVGEHVNNANALRTIHAH